MRGKDCAGKSCAEKKARGRVRGKECAEKSAWKSVSGHCGQGVKSGHGDGKESAIEAGHMHSERNDPEDGGCISSLRDGYLGIHPASVRVT